MFRIAYRIEVNDKPVYRAFSTMQEAAAYSEVVYRGKQFRIREVEDYPNSRFVNNTVLTIRTRHIN
jgi:hypothetical protein